MAEARGRNILDRVRAWIPNTQSLTPPQRSTQEEEIESVCNLTLQRVRKRLFATVYANQGTCEEGATLDGSFHYKRVPPPAGRSFGAPSGRPLGSGAATRNDLEKVVVCLLCEWLCSQLSLSKMFLYAEHSACSLQNSTISEEEKKRIDGLSRNALEKTREKAKSLMTANRQREAYVVPAMNGFAFIARYRESERLEASLTANVTGANRAAACWVTSSGASICSCAGVSAVTACYEAGGARTCGERNAMDMAIWEVSSALCEIWASAGEVSEQSTRDAVLAACRGGLLEMRATIGVCASRAVGDGASEEVTTFLLGPSGRLAAVFEKRAIGSDFTIAPVVLSHRERPTCCFCDNAQSCLHVGRAMTMFASRSRHAPRDMQRNVAGDAASVDGNLSSQNLLWNDEVAGFTEDAQSCDAAEACISTQPLPLFDCPQSISKDKDVLDAAMAGDVVRIAAPKSCDSCGSSDGSVLEISTGIVMASSGATAHFVLEGWECSSVAHTDEAARQSVGDGHKEFVFISTVNTAITHRLLRKLCAAHCGEGCQPLETLLRMFRADNRAERACASLRNIDMPLARGLQALRRCVMGGMRCIVYQEKDQKIFYCNSCEEDGKMSTLTADGIVQGFRGREITPFSRQYLDVPVPAMQRDALHVPHEVLDFADTRRQVAAVLRCCSGTASALQHRKEGLGISGGRSKPAWAAGLLTLAIVTCGCDFEASFADVATAIGNASLASRAALRSSLRISALPFARLLNDNARAAVSTELYVCLVPERDRIYCDGQALSVGKQKRLAAMNKCIESVMYWKAARHVSRTSQDCWWSKSAQEVTNSHVRAIPQLAESVLCESSVALLLSCDVKGAQEVSHFLSESHSGAGNQAEELRRLTTPFLSGVHGGAMSASQKILCENRILLDAVVAAASAPSPSSQFLLATIVSGLLFAAASTALEYYTAHDCAISLNSTDSAGSSNQCGTSTGLLEPRRRGELTKGAQARAAVQSFTQTWSGLEITDAHRSSLLRKRFIEMYPNAKQSPHETGVCFPGRPQVRPYPFYGATGSETNAGYTGRATPLSTASAITSTASVIRSLFGGCKKGFVGPTSTWTPGAFTVCCSCKHPKTLGFVVLDRAEGPLVLLNAVVGYFPFLPLRLIYDFACGAFRCAVLTLPWMVAGTRFVSDAFHWANRLCAMTFHPRRYACLDGQNTVAHEQLNRGINTLGPVLRLQRRENYVTVLWYFTKYRNFRALCADEVDRKRSDGERLTLENFDEASFYFSLYPCECRSCNMNQ